MKEQSLKEKAKTFNQIQEWVMFPSERRTDSCGGAYDVELTEARRKQLWVRVEDADRY